MRNKLVLIFCCALIGASGVNGLKENETETILPKNSEASSSNQKIDLDKGHSTSAANDTAITTTNVNSTSTNNTVATVTTSAGVATVLNTVTTPATIASTIASITPNVSTILTTTPDPKPTPIPDPKPNTWVINGSVIMVQMAAQIELMNNASNQNATKINIPSDNSTTASAVLSNTTESFILTWKSVNGTGTNNNTLVLSFKKYEESKKFSLSKIEVKIAPEELHDTNETLNLVHSMEHFNTTLGNSYRCIKLQHFNLTKISNMTQVVGLLKVTDFRMQAFKMDDSHNFGLAEDCAIDVSDVVPIAVGCVLAGLVVIVLAAYLISRKYSQARGYLSM